MTAGILDGKRILILEDDVLLAMDMEDFLSDLGCQVVGPVASVESALRIVDNEALDGAVLDLNLRGELSIPVIERLQTRNVPVIVCSGYAGLPGLKEKLGGVVIVAKPCDFERLESILDRSFNVRQTAEHPLEM